LWEEGIVRVIGVTGVCSSALLPVWKERGVRTIAPGLLPYELANALYERVRRGEMTLDEAQEGSNAIMDAGPMLLDHKALQAEALRLAQTLGCSASYDVALAEREYCECWTGDRGFWEAAKDTCPRTRWVGEGPDRPAAAEEGTGPANSTVGGDP
jgi:predicted nucleic acid-binding protein